MYLLLNVVFHIKSENHSFSDIVYINYFSLFRRK